MLGQAFHTEIVDFTNPEEAILYISTAYSPCTEQGETILLLDINMPQMTGWQFLQWFDTLAPKIKNRISIFMVSSSVDPRDMERAAAHPLVKAVLTKPLEIETIVKGIQSLTIEDDITHLSPRF
jgi:CheY-like chemotaxis protein